MSIELAQLATLFQNFKELQEAKPDFPSGAPDPKIVEAFQEAMQKQDPAPNPIATDLLPGPAQHMPETQMSTDMNLTRGLDKIHSAQEITQTHNSERPLLEELSRLINTEAKMLSQEDLLRIQYLAGQLKVQAETGKKVSEATSDTLEQLLDTQA